MIKRKREEGAAERADRATKLLRLEMRQRGHLAVPKRGADPAHDAREKALLKLATKGVVRLFNALAKAQKQRNDAAAGGANAKVKF